MRFLRNYTCSLKKNNLNTNDSQEKLSKGVSHYKYFRQLAGNSLTLKRFSIKLNIVNGKPYFMATCLKCNNFIVDIPLQLDRKWF